MSTISAIKWDEYVKNACRQFNWCSKLFLIDVTRMQSVLTKPSRNNAELWQGSTCWYRWYRCWFAYLVLCRFQQEGGGRRKWTNNRLGRKIYPYDDVSKNHESNNRKENNFHYFPAPAVTYHMCFCVKTERLENVNIGHLSLLWCIACLLRFLVNSRKFRATTLQ